jgi:hypothetical protein
MPRSRPFILLLGLILLTAAAPQPTVARPGERLGWELDYTVTATGTLNPGLSQLALTTTLEITTPEGGLSALILGVKMRGLSAWTQGTVTVDGVPVVPTWTRTMGLTLDLAGAPWVTGSQHTVVVEGVIDWLRSTDRQGQLRRTGSGSSLVLSAGDFLPLPVSPGFLYPVYSDALSAPAARLIRFTLVSPVDLPAAGVALAGRHIEGPASGSGRRWTAEIGPSRSYALLIGRNYGMAMRTLNLAGPGGGLQPISVRVYGPSATVRLTDLATAVRALEVFTAKFGPGPYTDYKVVGAASGGFAHEYPGLVLIGNNFTATQRRHVVRHEVAHWWWHSLVVNDQGHDGWLDESLAEWSAGRAWGNTAAPAYACTRTIDQPNSSAGYPTLFGTNGTFQCIYQKGAAFWYRLGATIGFTRLEGCLKSYAAANRFRVVGPVVLAQALRDCDERVMRVLRPTTTSYPFLSKATVDATR